MRYTKSPEKQHNLNAIWRKNLRTAGVFCMICALVLGMLPTVVKAEGENDWLEYFEYTINDPDFVSEENPNVIVLNKYKHPDYITELTVPGYAEIGGLTYRICLGRPASAASWRGVFSVDYPSTSSYIVRLDLSQIDTSHTRVMSSLFYGCNSLVSLNLNGFDTSAATSMRNMFYNCNNLLTLD